MTKQTSDVLVVGSGPVGLLTALGLGRAGLQVTVLEREEQLSQSPRAISYLWFVFDLLEGLGILDDVDRAGVRETAGMNLRVFRTGEVITMGFDVLEDLTPRPYVIQLGQDRLAAIALEHLRAYDNVTIRQGVCVTALAQREDHVSVLADGPDGAEELRAKWVVGADGASSTIRRLLGVEFSGMTWDERFVATNIRYDFGAHGFGTTNLLIDPEHGAVIAQIDRTGLYRVTYAESLDLPVETVPERMPRFFEAVLPGDKDYELVHYAPYRMHQRAADTFRLGRVLLAGDAAHATNPTGGLGLTSGLLDVEVLYPALAAVVRGTAPEEVLDRYAADRRQIFLEVASPQATELKRLVYHSTDPARLAADLAGLRTVAADRELRRGMQLNLARLRTGSLVPATA
jgi:3-(3-hydroxy-phenyl)propionate hydroxylase/6-hydroxy-3-succinoylpyridine 3-monooxygenase